MDVSTILLHTFLLLCDLWHHRVFQARAFAHNQQLIVCAMQRAMIEYANEANGCENKRLRACLEGLQAVDDAEISM